MVRRLENTDLPQLASFLSHLPLAFKVHGALLNVIEGKIHQDFWVDTWPDPKAVVVTPVIEDEFLSNVYNVFAVDQSALRSILDVDGLVNWESPAAFGGVSEESVSTIRKVARKHGWLVDTYGPEWNQLYTVVKKDDLKIINLPKNVTESGLSPKHATVLNDNWELNGGVISINTMKSYIEKYPSICLFDGQGQLAAYEAMAHCGAMSRLYVMPEHRRKGYGSYVTSALAQKCLAMGRTPYVLLGPENAASIRLHEKIGFTKAPNGLMTWIKTVKRDCG